MFQTRNIFIGSHGALKIGDFGLARDIVASPSPSNEYNSSFDFSGMYIGSMFVTMYIVMYI